MSAKLSTQMSDKMPDKMSANGTGNDDQVKDVEGQTPPPPSSRPSLMAPLAGVIFLIVGTTYIQMNVINNALKLKPCETCPPRNFEAPIWQTCIIHFSALLIYPLYLVDRHTTKLKRVTKPLGLSYNEKSEHPFTPQYMWMILGLLDVITNIAANGSLIFVAAATTRVIFALNIMLTAVLRRLFVKRFPTVYELSGICVVSSGVVIASISALTATGTQNNYGGKQWIGVLAAIITAIASSFNFIGQEYLYGRYNASALEAAASIGLYGTILDLLALMIGHFTGFENVKGSFYQMTSGQEGSKTLIITQCIQFCCMMIFPISSGVVVKIGSSVLRVVVNTGRTVAIWVVGLITGKPFGVLQFFGILAICLGVTAYHYNYFVKLDSWKYDGKMRKEVHLKDKLLNWWNGKARDPEEAGTPAAEPREAGLSTQVSPKALSSQMSQKDMSQKALSFQASQKPVVQKTSEAEGFHKHLDHMAPQGVSGSKTESVDSTHS